MTGARRRLADARLYLCVDGRRERGDLVDFLDAALSGGVDVVQLREKGLEAREELALLEIFGAAARRHGALLAVNDRADLARISGADVLHVGQGDLTVAQARSVVGDDMIVGVSTHAEAEVDAAMVEPGVDYFCVGPTWPTPTKPARPAPGIPLLKYAAGCHPGRPWFAIGGIDASTLDEVIAAGARRAVVVRAIADADDPHAAAAALASRLRAPAGAD
jgi:thiamine-phosphate pyrophosphorylase